MVRSTDSRLRVGRLFPFEVTISALGIVYLIMMLVLIARRSLLPGIVLVGTFILFVLWLAGLIQTSVMMFGPSGGVNSNCNIYVFGSPVSGVSVYSLAYLQQKNICELFEWIDYGWQDTHTRFVSRSKLASGFCIRDSWHSLPVLDDGNELASKSGR